MSRRPVHNDCATPAGRAPLTITDNPAGMYKLLLHVGLPKTATTSLQANVLMPLHEQRRINFLGRYVDDTQVFDPFENVLKRIKTRPLTPSQLQRLRPVVETMLDRDCMNVISNETIAGMETVGDDAPSDALATLHNLSGLFRGDDVTVLLTLRRPVDFVFSAYVESWYWRLHARRKYDKFAKFLSELLRQSPGNPSWIVFFYDAYLRALARHFDRIEVLLYEDLEHDCEAWFWQLAACLQSDPHEIRRLFVRARRNPGVYARSGKRSRRPTVKHILAQHAPGLLKACVSCRPILARVPPMLALYARVASIDIPVSIEHPYPDEVTRQRLQQQLGLRDDTVMRTHGVSAEKLVRYGYLHPAYPRCAPSGAEHGARGRSALGAT